jgi:uncharacterized membrane protein SirB2
MSYSDWRLLHMSCAGASFALFLLRGGWMLWRPALLQQRWVRIVPHVVDTAFLGSGLWLTTIVQQYPFADGWLTVKFFGLVAYIVLGTIALKRGRTRAIRTTAFVAAALLFVYIAGVARAHDAASWLRWLS